MNKPNSTYVMLRGPAKAKKPDGTESDFLHITIRKNDDELDTTGYEFTEIMNDNIEVWTVVEEQTSLVAEKARTQKEQLKDSVVIYKVNKGNKT